MISPWKSAVIAKNGTLSAEVDLGRDYKKILVLLPVIDSATISPQISTASGGTFYPVHIVDADATGSFLHATTAGVGSVSVIFNIGGAQFVKFLAGAAQTTAAVTLYVRGVY